MGAGFNVNVGIIRAFAFGLLTLSVFIANGFKKTFVNTLKDPFWIGAFGMCISWIICLKNNSLYIFEDSGDYNKINITHAAMTFFIITKVIAHTEHGGHYGPWGVKVQH